MMDKEYIAFDQFQRYQTFAHLIEYHRAAEGSREFRILELGANEHKDLGLFLEKDDILYTDVVLTEAMQQDPAFVQADGTNLPFADRSFDFVVAADVFEHIPQDKRTQFLAEAYRVASKGVVLSFPFASGEIADAEERVNTYFEAIAGQEFVWLKEHAENGLPALHEVDQFLEQEGIHYFRIQHGDLDVWEKMWYCHFNAVFMPETVTFRTKIDHYYNRNIYRSDVSDKCYRIFYVMSRENTSEWERYANSLWEANKIPKAEQMDMLMQAQRNIHSLYQRNVLQSQIKEKEAHIHNLNVAIIQKDNHIANLGGIIAAKDNHITNLDGIIAAKEQQITILEEDLRSVKQCYEAAIAQEAEAKEQLTTYKNHYHAAIAQRDDYNRQLAHYQRLYHEISNATFWKMTAPLRTCATVFKKIVKSNRYTHLLFKGLKSLFREGFSVTWKKAKRKLFNVVDYGKARMPLYTEEELEQQKTVKFPKEIKFSILVPLYNTPEKFLNEMILSVQNQTYANWELCLADGSDAEHGYVGKIVKQYAKKDKRIIYQKLAENKGISGNTNACIDMATGDYIALFDHDDLLHPAALYEMMHAICDKNADFIYTDENTFEKTPEDAYCPHFKADFAPDTLRSYNYICHFTAFAKELLEKAGGGFRPEFDGSQDYDIILRLTEQAQKIVHIPKILYYWRSHANSVASDVSAKPYTMVAAKRALQEHLQRVGLKGEVLDSSVPSTYRIAYEIKGEPLVSILIPNKDHIDDLKKCIDSIRNKSTYQNWEIIVIENNSTEAETFAYYKELEEDSRIQVVTWKDEFNYSAINNFGAQSASGDHLLLLNNDVEIITPDWIEQMLMFSQRKDVGAVGAMLYYPDDTIQHAGVIVGLGGVAGHSHKYFPRNHKGYMVRLTIAQNYSCVTAACIMISRNVWEAVGGLDAQFKVAFNDVDLCMRIRKAGYLVVWTPYAELYHYESKSRGMEDTPEKQKRFQGEMTRFQTRWRKELDEGDPYYNPNLTLDREDFSLKNV